MWTEEFRAATVAPLGGMSVNPDFSNVVHRRFAVDMFKSEKAKIAV